ncbi:hypothetical protein [Mycobacteroides franklinii]|uniref:DUF7352 domain-containing protein n=1 Tax=Mycobacteroides franklinii TaxID=948102 RepID=A0A4R5P6L2_9MYCO|nr:hypothetical protein [Mycobacteroides franklinii]ORA62192.1 hypothetical protein BST24_08600 [Mycobacteroides franklinii]TDH18989.1 hypothetical protein EJ571_20620 [Mycobacteroides franklinii]
MRIIRHALRIDDYQEVTLPSDGDLLSVAQSRRSPNGLIDLWSLDFEHGEGWTKGIYIVGTGNPMPDQLRDSANTQYRRNEHRYSPGFTNDVFIMDEDPKPWRKFIGTVVTPSGLVWHVFEGPLR